ncbi:STAS domain-containing protein [Streptomyces sp. NPDC006458]|uniref:STAS domain-containing protein n=1 Tax=Streptomyces sp. NPDC006458 TaxID=3154302 RepID=UPI0033B1DAA7
MTAAPENAFELAVTLDDDGDAHITIAGDLDWETADELTDAARVLLKAAPPPGRLRVDCGRMTLCDSLGLASLLMIHRIATATGTRLQLENRPTFLRRLLGMTGTVHLFAALAAGHGAGPEDADAGGAR